MKYLYGVFLSVLCILFFPSCVSAAEFPDTLDLLGLTYEEFLEYEIQPDIFEFPNVNVFSDFNPDYVKDNNIKLSSTTYVTTHTDYPFTRTGTLTFGSTYYATNMCYRADISLSNGGSPLFDEPGIFTLKVHCYCNIFEYTIYYADGSNFYSEYIPNGTTTVYEFDFDNSANDIVQIDLVWRGGVKQSTKDTHIGFGILDYGYLVDKEEPEPEPDEPEIPLVSGDINGSLEFLLSFIVVVVESLFVLQLLPGITFGYFLLGVMIFALIFRFLFSNMVK